MVNKINIVSNAYTTIPIELQRMFILSVFVLEDEDICLKF